MKFLVHALLAGALLTGAAHAAQSFNKSDLNQVQLRYSECTAFYLAGAKGFDAYGKPEEAESLLAHGHAALELAVVIGTRIGLSEDEMNGRMASAERWVMERAGNDLVHYDQLIEEMGAPCLDLLQYPPRALFSEGAQSTQE